MIPASYVWNRKGVWGEGGDGGAVGGWKGCNGGWGGDVDWGDDVGRVKQAKSVKAMSAVLPVLASIVARVAAAWAFIGKWCNGGKIPQWWQQGQCRWRRRRCAGRCTVFPSVWHAVLLGKYPSNSYAGAVMWIYWHKNHRKKAYMSPHTPSLYIWNGSIIWSQ